MREIDDKEKGQIKETNVCEADEINNSKVSEERQQHNVYEGDDRKKDEVMLEDDTDSISHNLDIEREKYQCDICITKFESNCILLDHMKKMHKQSSIEYVCSNCKYISKTEAGMKRHENVFCEHCNVCLPGSIDYNIHMSFHKTCEMKNCEYKANNKAELKDHIISVNG